MIKSIKSFVIKNKQARYQKDIDRIIDEAYIQGAKNERLRIIAVLDRVIYDNRNMDSWTSLARQVRDSLVAHHARVN
jgi:hypothetical protein